MHAIIAWVWERFFAEMIYNVSSST